MDKAIKVTNLNRTLNPKYLRARAVGSVVIFKESNFPKVWATPAWTKEYFDKREKFHAAAGFHPVKVTYNPETQYIKAAEIFLDETDPEDIFYTYPVHDFTQAELNAKAEAAEHQEAATEESTRASEGLEEANYIFKELRRLKNKGTLSPVQFVAAQNLLFDALLPMTFGLWDITQARLDAITPPQNATLLNVYNTIKSRVGYLVETGTRQNT